MFETGANEWRTLRRAGRRKTGVSPRKLYFQADGKLSFDPPTGDATTRSTRTSPIPPTRCRTAPRPIPPTYGPGSTWSTWLVEDQRFVHDRPDVLS